jgi:hypothetical protein
VWTTTFTGARIPVSHRCSGIDPLLASRISERQRRAHFVNARPGHVGLNVIAGLRATRSHDLRRAIETFDLDASFPDVLKKLLEVGRKGVTVLIRHEGVEISKAATGPDSIFQHHPQIYLCHLIRRHIELSVFAHRLPPFQDMHASQQARKQPLHRVLPAQLGDYGRAMNFSAL